MKSYTVTSTKAPSSLWTLGATFSVPGSLSFCFTLSCFAPLPYDNLTALYFVRTPSDSSCFAFE